MPFGLSKASVLGAAGSSGGGGTLDVLYTTTLSTNTNTVSFTNVDSIASTYRTLVLQFFAVGVSGTNNWNDLLYSGTDHSTATNFSTHSWGSGVNTTSFYEYSYNDSLVAGGGGSTSASWYAQSAGGWIWFPNWQDDNFNRGAMGINASSASSAYSYFISSAIGSSGNTSGTTISIANESSSSNWYAGSHFTLCGLGGTK